MSRLFAAAMLASAALAAAPAPDYAKRDIFTDGEFFVGCNYWCRNAGMYMWSQWDQATLEKEIGELAKNGVKVMRVFPMWQDFQPLTGDCFAGGAYRSYRFRDNLDLPNSAGVDDVMIERFRFMCDVCAKHDIKLIVGIVTGWMSGRQFVPYVFEEKNVLSDPAAIMWETRFVKYFVEKLKDHPAIAAWDYGNECNCMGANACGQAAFYNWMDHIGMAIRSKDSSRPVVSGMHSLQTGETEAVNVRLNGEISDILCTHPYALYVPGCGKEAFNTMRTELHPTAESLLYRDLGGKPCFIEEIGNLGTEYASDERSAAGIRATMFSAWANDLKGLLWWCNSDQEGLDFPPYNLTACERELGLLRQDWSPKPVMLEMKRFEEFRKSLPFRKLPPRHVDCCIVVPEKVNGWIPGFGCYLLAKQAGFDPVFAGAENSELPDCPFYIVASVDRDSGYSFRAQRKWRAKAEAGATVMVVLGGSSRFTHFREWTGLKVDYGCRSAIERKFVFAGEAMSVRDDFTTRLLPDGATVLAAAADGEPVLAEFKCGKGRIVVANGSFDRNAIERADCFTGKNPVGYWRLFAKARELAGVKGVVEKVECPWVGVTEHPVVGGSTIVVAINFEPRDIKCPIKLAGRVGRVWRGDVKSDSINLPPNDAAVFEVLR